MNKFPLSLALNYYWDAQTIYSAHSPFIYNFFTNVLNGPTDRKEFLLIEKERQRLIQSRAEIDFIEFGAGSFSGKNGQVRSVSEIARHSLSGAWQCRILFNLIREFHLKSVLEVGTSLGISTAYLSSGAPKGTIVTLEGNPSSGKIASDVWQRLKLNNIDLKVGEFGETMRAAANQLGTIDFAFLDGNHRKRATLDYFDLFKNYVSQHSIFIVDDIYWSKDMNEAWRVIIKDDSVAFSIDLFRMGVLFFDNSIMSKQHFKLIPYRFKPWAIGLFG